MMTPKDRYWRWSTVMSEKNVQTLLSTNFISILAQQEYKNRKSACTNLISENGDLNEVLLSDTNMVLPGDMLFKADMMSMANGLEVREPFLDHRLVEFAFSLPVEYKINDLLKKRLVRETFKEILPLELYDRPKKGFEVPLVRFYQRELRSMIIELLDKNFVHDQGIFNPVEIEKFKNKILTGQYYDQGAVWSVIAFQYWWKKYMSK